MFFDGGYGFGVMTELIGEFVPIDVEMDVRAVGRVVPFTSRISSCWPIIFPFTVSPVIG